jgi:two-component system chemotaxis response regulator CheB
MKIRVVIVDDSPFVREVLRAVLARYPELDIVGEAGDGKSAEQLIEKLRPDVVTMDVVMPLVSGIDAIGRIMARRPTPIVVVSDARGGVDELMVQAVGAGAVDVYVKPTRGFDDNAAAQLAAVIRNAATARLPARPVPAAPRTQTLDEVARRIASASVIGIVSSTGGPSVLHQLIAALPRGFRVPIAIVQHTAVGFTSALVSWLRESTRAQVDVGQHGKVIRGVVIAPDDHHMEVNRNKEIVLHRGPPVRGHRPSGTILLQSLAVHGRGAVGIVCTGMHDDGAAGLAALEAAGGVAIVEDPQTAMIDSMPRGAIAATQAPVVASVARIAELLNGAGSSA